MLYSNGSNDSTYRITGRLLAHCRRSAARRALLAADLVTGRARLVKPTETQVAALLRVSPAYVRKAVRIVDIRGLRSSVENQRMPLVRAAEFAATAGLPKPKPAALLTYQPPADPNDADLTALARTVGTDRWLAAGAAAGL